MVKDVEDSAKANIEFATSTTTRAAEIIRDARKERIPVIDALRKARDEFLLTESEQRKKARTYHFSNLVNDLKWYVIEHENGDPDSFTPISQWEEALRPQSLAEKLKTAGETIAQTVRERTITEGWLGTLDDKELAEHVLMQEAVRFLSQQGIQIEIKWERGDPNSPIDYHGEVEGEAWAFELKQLRDDPEGFHRKIGNPNEKKPISEQLEFLEKPLPQIPSGPESLRKNLTRLAQNAQKEAKKKAANGAKYCLVIHNRQFLHIPDWEGITWPNLGSFDAVMVLHDETVPPARVWQVIPPDAFGRTVKSGTLQDLEKLVLAQQGQGPDPAIVKGAWLQLRQRGITEQDILDALEDVRRNG